MPITERYVQSLADIYRDVLSAFPSFDTTRKAGHGLSFQSLYSALDGQYTLGEIRTACKEMEKGGVVTIKNQIFAQPTQVGEELIAKVTKGRVAEPQVPPFPPPN